MSVGHTLVRNWCLAAIFLVGSGCVALSPEGATVIVKRTQMHMGTLVSITAVGPNDLVANDAINVGFQEIKRLEQLLSTWIPDSELSRVNASAGVKPVLVSPETLAVVRRSLQVAELTGGAFNIALGPAISTWNISAEPRLPSAAELDAARPLLALRGIQH